MNPGGEYSQRKALLIAKADLERLKLRFALREMKQTISPAADAVRPKWAAPVAGTVLALALPALGLQRIQHIVRMVSTALLAYRILSKWQQGQ